jgi:hypothetical protein
MYDLNEIIINSEGNLFYNLNIILQDKQTYKTYLNVLLFHIFFSTL